MSTRRRLESLPLTTLGPLLAKAMTTASEAMFITDRQGIIVWVNDAFSRLSGYSAQEALGRTPRFVRSGVQNDTFYRELWNTILAGNTWRGEVVDRHKNGSLYVVDEIITPLRDNGAVTYFLAVQHDITSHKKERDLDHYLAYHDALTGLPNRRQFFSVLQQSMTSASHNNDDLALLFLDFDHFKPINDNLGHSVGDKLLIAAAQRLRSAVRRIDIVARLSGDEFAILEIGFSDPEMVAAQARKLIGAIAEPFTVEGHRIQITASIGVAFYPGGGGDADELFSNADRAMYEAKREGGNAYHIHGDGSQ
jgi:diguanylate cyclase